MPRQKRRDAGYEILRHVRKRINESYGSDLAFRKTYLQEQNGCVPAEFVGDELLYSIKDKYYWLLDAVRVQLDKEFGRDRCMWVHVDPTYEDTTYALLTLENEHILFTYCAKAWNVWWPNEAEMKKELVEWLGVARERYKKFEPLLPKQTKG